MDPRTGLNASETRKTAWRCQNSSTDSSVVHTYDVSQNWFKRNRTNDKTVLLLHSTAPLLYKDLKLRKIKVSLAANQRANFFTPGFYYLIYCMLKLIYYDRLA